MELIRKKPFFYTLTFLWMLLILLIGVWWLYLILTLGEQLEILYELKPSLSRKVNYVKLALWEGGTFFILLTASTGTLVWLYSRDRRKTRSIQAFFAALTHELKTPLASIRLQAEVMDDKISEKKFDDLPRFMNRLLEGTQQLEGELDKLLHLSRVELGDNLKLQTIDLKSQLEATLSQWKGRISVRLHSDLSTCEVEIDKHALEVIIKNIIENSLNHAQTQNLEVTVKLVSMGPNYHVIFTDNGERPELPSRKLGILFNKGKSSKGSGIGLYLISKLMKQMNGKLLIETKPCLKFILEFPSEVRV